ncbi:MAG: hypothetical protein C7B44_07090 [Sulfobacillus thermosulfidooxidans]|nr:MAG: hypothetical protein C7B44_07090 [Sulfobacillus thermosulfidooxidans]
MVAAGIYVIGVPPEGLKAVEESWRRVIQSADWVYGGRRLLNMLPSGSQTLEISSPLTPVLDHLRVHEGTLRVVLATGDPNFFGVAEAIYRNIPASLVTVVPALSSMQAAFARLKMSWHDAYFGSVHGRPLEQAISWVARYNKVVILTDPHHNTAALAKDLTARGFGEVTLYVCANLGMDSEKVFSGTAMALQGADDDGFSVVVVCNPHGGQAVYGMDDDRLLRPEEQPGMMTKKAVRAVSIAQLGLSPRSILWDIGAGTGAVSIDASRVIGPQGAVYAVEANPQDYEILCQNIQTHQAPVYPILGRAPQGLESLPDPDAVFIGGSGGQLAEIIDSAGERLHVGGRMVLTLVRFDHLTQLSHLFPRHFHWTVQWLSSALMNPERQVPRFVPENPVFVVTAEKGVKQ